MLSESAGRAVLGALLAMLILAAATVDRSEWSSFLGDEATYLMAAESIAWDLDLVYERRDFDRFVEHWGRDPEGLILQTGDRGRTLAFGKPFFYSAALAPFVRWSPTQGPFVFNAVLLAVAAWIAWRALRARLGPAAPWWTAAFVFASVTFCYAFWAHADLFLLSLTAIALALAFGEPQRSASFGRWIAVGALLAVVVFSRPIYAPLFLPAVLAAPQRGRARAWLAIFLGAALLFGGAGLVHQLTSSEWTSYGGQRGGFYSWTGFPAVDFPNERWEEVIGQFGNVAWGDWLLPGADSTAERAATAKLWAWDAVYLLVGRSVGLLPYYLPLVLALVALPSGAARWALLAAIVVSCAGLLLLRPFNFYGGGAAIGNRYFLPLYPAVWFLAGRRRGAIWALVVALAAAPFLWPLWLQGPGYPRSPDLTWRYISPQAERWLPYETTQSHLKPSGQEDVIHNTLWIKLLDPSIRSQEGVSFALVPGDRGTMLIGRIAELAEIEIRTDDPRAPELQVAGARLVDAAASAEGATWRLAFDRPRARHPMWWSARPVHLYEVELSFAAVGVEPVLFTVHPAAGMTEHPPRVGTRRPPLALPLAG